MATNIATAEQIADYCIRGIENWVEGDERDYSDWEGAGAIEYYCYTDGSGGYLGDTWVESLPPRTDEAEANAEIIINDFLATKGVVVFA